MCIFILLPSSGSKSEPSKKRSEHRLHGATSHIAAPRQFVDEAPPFVTISEIFRGKGHYPPSLRVSPIWRVVEKVIDTTDGPLGHITPVKLLIFLLRAWVRVKVDLFFHFLPFCAGTGSDSARQLRVWLSKCIPFWGASSDVCLRCRNVKTAEAITASTNKKIFSEIAGLHLWSCPLWLHLEDVWGECRYSSTILDFSTRWSAKPTPLGKGWPGPQSSSGRCGEETISWPCQELNSGRPTT
jgi:hypothetical protein